MMIKELIVWLNGFAVAQEREVELAKLRTLSLTN
jgi:hypothetical protein